MIIDFNDIEEAVVMNFKGGEGELRTRNFADGKNKIMFSHLKPGAWTGMHTHTGNSEIIYVVSGKGYFKYDDGTERIAAGQVHYCPVGHSHSMINDGEEDLIYFAIVPEHH